MQTFPQKINLSLIILFKIIVFFLIFISRERKKYILVVINELFNGNTKFLKNIQTYHFRVFIRA